MHRLLSFLLILSASFAVAQTVGQYEVRKRTSTGFTAYGVTLSNGQALGQSGGIPAAINISGGTWGSITGTLSAQTDLQTALDAKEAALTFSTGLTRTTNTITVNTTQNIAKLSNLTSNGFIKTSSSDGTLNVDTTSYLATSAVGSTVQAYSANLDTLSTGFGAIVVGSGLLKWVPGTGYALAGSVAVGDIGSMANNTLVGNVSGLSSNASALTATQVATMLTTASDTLLGVSTNGFVKRSGANTYSIDTSTYLTANQTITFSGDLTGSGSTAITTTLATVNSNVGSYGSASDVPVITVNAKGLITAVSTASITVPTAANPTASIGLTATNGSASTFMRSDAAPALNQAIVPTWTGQHTFAAGTLTTSAPLTITQTWNAGSVTFTGLRMNITRTAAASTSMLMDLQQGGTSALNAVVNSTGNVKLNIGLRGANLDTSTDYYTQLNGYFGYIIGQTSGGANFLANPIAIGNNVDAYIERIAANTIALKNGTAQNYFRVYATTTGPKYAELTHDGTNTVLRSVSGGVSIPNVVTLGSGGTAVTKMKHGTAVLSAGTVTVSDTDTVETGAASTSSRILINRMTDGGTVGDSYSITRTNGTSFTITSKTAGATQTLDTSTVSWLMINP